LSMKMEVGEHAFTDCCWKWDKHAYYMKYFLRARFLSVFALKISTIN